MACKFSGSGLCRVMAAAPTDVQALSSHGYCMRKLHRMEEAVEDYTRAISNSQPCLRLHNNRAYCLAKLERYDQAVNDYSAVLGLDAANLHALQNRCDVRCATFGANRTFDALFVPAEHRATRCCMVNECCCRQAVVPKSRCRQLG